MNLPTITQLAKGEAEFQRYEDGKLWYRINIACPDSRAGCEVVHFFDFPIDVTDAGGGAFLPKDKALTFMRWIRKHLDFLRKIDEEERAMVTAGGDW